MRVRSSITAMPSRLLSSLRRNIGSDGAGSLRATMKLPANCSGAKPGSAASIAGGGSASAAGAAVVATVCTATGAITAGSLATVGAALPPWYSPSDGFPAWSS
eukprot:535830-Prymnesium_polylepis.1